MREIKFRAWLKNENKMAKVHSIHLNKKRIMVTYRTAYGASGNYAVDDGNYVLQQYTGLKDKNGVEIYEGDILLWEQGWMYPEMNGEIQRVENGYYFVQPEHNVKWLMTQKSLSAAKIIGNIFEGVDE